MRDFTWDSTWVVVLLCAMAPVQLAGQGGALSLVLGGGQDLDPGDTKLGAAEVRWEARSTGVTPVLMAGVQVAENGCSDSLPPICDFPGSAGLQIRAGMAAPFEVGPGELALVPSGGAVRWGDDWDLSLRLDAVIRFGVGQGAQFEVGARQDFLWISRRSETVVTRERRVDLVGLALGLRFGTGR